MPPRRPQYHWPFVAFLLGFTILLIIVCYYFLFPALTVFKHASKQERAHLRAWSSLILSILLITLLCGLMLTFRVGRFFFPRPTPPRTQTKYIDVWSEAGKRLETPTDEEGEDGE